MHLCVDTGTFLLRPEDCVRYLGAGSCKWLFHTSFKTLTVLVLQFTRISALLVLVTLCLIFKLFEDNHVHLQLILKGYHYKTWL